MSVDAARLLRAAASSQAPRVTHPAARYVGERLSCALCSKVVAANAGAAAAALWAAHLKSGGHITAASQLRGELRAASAPPPPAAAAAAAAPAPPSTSNDLPSDFFDAPRGAASAPAPSASATASSSLPAGFFDDAREDAAAQGIDHAAVARAAKDAEVNAFLSWAKTVEDDEPARLVAEEAAFEDKRVAASAENGLYRARVAVLRDLVEGRVGVEVGGAGGGGADASGAGGGVDTGVLEDELLSIGVAAPNGEAVGINVAEVTATLTERVRSAMARVGGGGRGAIDKRKREEEGGEEEEEDLLDWRRKR